VIRFNPLSGVLEMLHSSMYYGKWPPAWCWVSGAAWAAGLLIRGACRIQTVRTVSGEGTLK